MVEQRRMNPSNNKYAPMYITQIEYKADVAQRKTQMRATNKGKNIKIGNDHELTKFIKMKIVEEKWSPDAIIGYIKANGLIFKGSTPIVVTD